MFYVFDSVHLSVCLQCQILKFVHQIFHIFHEVSHKLQKVTNPIVEKKIRWVRRAQKAPKMTKNEIFGVLKRQLVWEKFGSWVIIQKPLDQSEWRIFETALSLTTISMKMNFWNWIVIHRSNVVCDFKWVWFDTWACPRDDK